MDKAKVARGLRHNKKKKKMARAGSVQTDDDDVIVIMKIPKQAIKGINETKRNGMNERMRE